MATTTVVSKFGAPNCAQVDRERGAPTPPDFAATMPRASPAGRGTRPRSSKSTHALSRTGRPQRDHGPTVHSAEARAAQSHHPCAHHVAPVSHRSLRPQHAGGVARLRWRVRWEYPVHESSDRLVTLPSKSESVRGKLDRRSRPSRKKRLLAWLRRREAHGNAARTVGSAVTARLESTCEHHRAAASHPVIIEPAMVRPNLRCRPTRVRYLRRAMPRSPSRRLRSWCGLVSLPEPSSDDG